MGFFNNIGTVIELTRDDFGAPNSACECNVQAYRRKNCENTYKITIPRKRIVVDNGLLVEDKFIDDPHDVFFKIKPFDPNDIRRYACGCGCVFNDHFRCILRDAKYWGYDVDPMGENYIQKANNGKMYCPGNMSSIMLCEQI